MSFESVSLELNQQKKATLLLYRKPNLSEGIESLYREYLIDALRTKTCIKKIFLIYLILSIFCFQSVIARQQNMIPTFSPKSGPVGSIVTISSVGNTSQYTVFFGAVKAEILSAREGTLTVRVPRGATNSPISVTRQASFGISSVMSAQAFMVTFPNVGELSLTHQSNLTSAGVSTTAIADIDNDGKPDIIALNTGSNQFSIFRNTSTYDGTGFSFAAASIFNTGASPQSVAVGDLNMDGKLDLVLANSADNTIYVFINQSTSGNLSLAAPLIVTAGSPTFVTIGELNKDYRPDIVATNSSGNKISVLHNASTLGSGFSLSTRADFATGSNPVSVALGNMDLAHGVLHITTANRGDNSLSAFQIESFGNYIISKVIATGTEPSYITYADIDADGLSEMMVVNSGSSSVSIYRNKRGGSSSGVSFEDKIDFSFGSGVSSAAVSDLDGDGKNDIIGIGGGVLSFLRSTTSLANIGFAPKIDFNAQNNPVAIAVADLNGDSRPDILLSDPLANSIQILENKLIAPVVDPPLITSIAPLKGPVGAEIVISGSGFDAIPSNNLVSFGSVKATVLSSSTNLVRVSVPLGIVTSKLSITNRQNSLSTRSIETFHVTFDTLSSVSFGEVQNVSAGDIPYKLVSADFDGDGLIDIATFLGNGGRTPAIFQNKSSNGKSKFQKTVINGAFEYLSGVAAEDLNGDGKPDLIFSSSRQYVYIFENISSPGTISFGSPKKYVTSTLGLMGNGILSRDIDHDGRPDIIISGRLEIGNTQALTVLLNRSQTTLDFSRSLSFPFFEGAGSVYELAAGDLNADGKTDLVVTSPIRDSIYIYRNESEKGNLAFNISGIKTAAFPSGIVMEDIDADGKLDINVINKSQGLSSYRNISTGGNINFGPAHLTGIGKHSLSIKSSDLNGDGKPDFVISNYGDSTITVLRNYSSPANFNYTSETISSGAAAYDLALEDINLDGKPEIVFSNLSANSISVLQNETLSALNLKQLTLNTGTIFPEFSPPVKEYEIKVAPETSSVNFNAEAAIISATLNLNAALLGTGTGSKSVSISSDTTLVELSVTHSSQTNTYNFKILRVPVPIIESFAPLQGPPGTIIEIKGRNFENPLSLKIGTKEAVIVSSSSNEIKAMLMPGSLSGEVKFSNSNGTSSSLPNQFTVTGTGIPSTLIGAKLYDEQAMSMGASSALSSDGTTMVAGTSSSSGGFWIYARSQNTDAWVKKGSKRKGSGESGDNSEGISIAISANGNTIATGAPGDNNGFGAVWIYERSSDDWVQQGLKLTATSGSGLVHFGSSVSLSADGNTLLIGAEKHSLGDGWIWVFTRNAGVWTEQQSFTGLDQTRPASKGSNVKLSADGNRALFTGHTNNVNNGMVWLFSRSNGFWKHEAKFSSGEAGAMNFGSSIDLSADGRTAIIGSAAYQSTGASWIYTEAGGVWTKQAKLIGTGATGNARQGESVAISADGNIAFVGGSADDANKGAFWIFKRTGSAWQQVGIKGTINGTSGNSKLGSALDISSDGLFAVLGTPADEQGKGGVWMHKYIPPIATLSSLTLSTGSLDPVFSSEKTSYSVNVANGVSFIKVSPALSDTLAIVRVNGILVLKGSASPDISLVTGENIISVQVTAQDTSIKKTYTVRVTRAAPSAIATLSSISLSLGTLSPLFAAETGNYFVELNNNTAAIKVSAALSDTSSRLTLNGLSFKSGFESNDIILGVGSNILTFVITAEDGTTKKSYTVNIVRAAANQTYPDSKGAVTVSSNTPQVMVMTSSKPITVTVPDGVSNASINYSSLISSGTGLLPQTTLNSSVAQLTIPSGTTVTSSSTSWNGVLNVPQPTTYELPNSPGEITTYGLRIEVGSPDVSLLFDKAVRLVLPGQAGKRAGFVRQGIFTEITRVGTNDSQSEGDALAAGGAYKIDVGQDLVIWTKELAKFITFTRSIDPDIALVALDMASLTDSAIKGSNIDLEHVINSLTNPLPLTGSSGSQITWTSGNPLVLSSDGRTVVRPASGITTVTLTAIVKKGNIITSKTFTIKILAISAPQISSFSPEIAIEGTMVTIAGTEFTNATAVSFGGRPAKSFTVTSSTSISAVVGDGATGAIMVVTPSGMGSREGFSYRYSLAANNFKLQTISESCRNSNNGSVTIVAEKELNYRVTIKGANVNKEVQFTKMVTVGDLQAGSYGVCITVIGWDGYQQCYNVVITEPQELSAFITVKQDERIMSVDLTGSDRYILDINGKILTTTKDHIELPLDEGENRIKISTEKECQGIIERTIRIEHRVPFPNPFERNLSIMLGNKMINTLKIVLRDQTGRTVYGYEYVNQSGTLQINLPELTSGVYLLMVSKDGKEGIYKVIRK